MDHNKKRKIIGFLVTGITDTYSVKLIQGVARAARNLDLDILVMPGKYLDRDLSRQFEDTYEYQFTTLYSYAAAIGLDGLIISANTIGCHSTTERMQEFVRNFAGIPSVLVATHMEGHTCICYENTMAVREGLRALIQEEGCRHICILEGPPSNTDVMERKKVYLEVLEEYGLPFEPRMCENGNLEASVKSTLAAERLLKANPEMDALFCLNDYMAIAAYEVMKRYGLRPGEDIKILGFDNVPESWTLDPPLATIGADPILLGEKALECLLKIMEGQQLDNMILPAKLIRRRSLGGYQPGSLQQENELSVTREDFAGIYFRYILFHDEEEVERSYQRFQKIFQDVVDFLFYPDPETKPRCSLTQIMKDFDRVICSDLLPYMDTEVILRLVRRIEAQISSAQQLRQASQVIPEIYRCLVRAGWRNFGSVLQKKLDIDDSKKVFVKETMNFRHGNDHSYQVLLRYLGWAGVDEGCLYIYDDPVIHMDKEVFVPPKSVLLKTYLHDGTVNEPVVGSQRRNTQDGLIPDELSDSARCMMLAPLFFSEEHYGLFLCNVSEMLYYEGEFIIIQLGSAVRMLQLLAENEGIQQQMEDHLAVMRKMNIELDSLSRSDELTGLLNRRGFMNRGSLFLREMQQEGHGCLAGYVDMDNLKVVNDRFGHDDGDYALRVIAEVLTRTMQGERCILGRIGGDEFVFLLAGTEDRAGSVKTAIYDAFAAFNQASSKEYNVTVSVGIWTAPADMQVTLEDMLSYADTVLYEEKQNKDRNILKHL